MGMRPSRFRAAASLIIAASILEDDAILIASAIDKQTQRISGVALAFEKDGKAPRELFGN